MRKVKKKLKRMPLWRILWLIEQKRYIVCRNTGQVTGPKGKVITPFWKKTDTTKHLYVRLYHNGTQVRSISLGKLVWMSVTMEQVPVGFHIHHWDEIPQNNGWDNLLCLHNKDHQKFHRQSPGEDAPF